MTQVEIGQETTVERWQSTKATEEEQGRQYASVEESRVPLRRAADPTIVESGIHFQRCGGGRRVLRNHRRD